jgi:hypothetical protein
VEADQRLKSDTGYGYVARLIERIPPGGRPEYDDVYQAFGGQADLLNTSLGFLGEAPLEPLPTGGSRLGWTSLAPNQAAQVHHAAILAFIARPISSAAGATPHSEMSFFVDGHNIEMEFGGGDDHSRLFDSSLSDPDGRSGLRAAYKTIILTMSGSK